MSTTRAFRRNLEKTVARVARARRKAIDRWLAALLDQHCPAAAFAIRAHRPEEGRRLLAEGGFTLAEPSPDVLEFRGGDNVLARASFPVVFTSRHAPQVGQSENRLDAKPSPPVRVAP